LKISQDLLLNLAIRVYLESDVKYDMLANTVSVSAIVDWFEDYFNREEGILNLLRKF